MATVCKLLGLLSLFLAAGAYAQQQGSDYNGFETVAPEGSVGDIGTLNLKPPSVSFHPMNNDFMGDTDKYLTGSATLGILFAWMDKNKDLKSFNINGYWRAISPAKRPKDGEPEFNKPVGIYADWMEVQMAYSVVRPTILGGFKFQLGFAYGDIGNHGIEDVHKRIHAWVGQADKDVSYEGQHKGETYGSQAMFAHIIPAIPIFGLRLNWQTAVGGQTGMAMDEYFFKGNAILSITKNFRAGFERKIIKQVSSEFYENIRYTRYESTFSILLGEYYQPAIKYVSPYLKEDDVGQIYVDFVNLTIPF